MMLNSRTARARVCERLKPYRSFTNFDVVSAAGPISRRYGSGSMAAHRGFNATLSIRMAPLETRLNHAGTLQTIRGRGPARWERAGSSNQTQNFDNSTA